MTHYLKLARPHHWVKNVIVLFPLVFSGQLLQIGKLLEGLWSFLAFSLLASAIYCINDIRDRDKDRVHPTKRLRPVAAGTVSVRGAMIWCGILLALAAGCGVLSAGASAAAWLWLGLYFILNLGYSLGLKNLPIIDVAILASGFLLRLLYGGAALEIELSKWLCLTVIAISFFLGLGKRRGELVTGGGRKVLEYYSEQFLGYNMYMCVALAVMFYALWTVDAMTVRGADLDGAAGDPVLYALQSGRGGTVRRGPGGGPAAGQTAPGPGRTAGAGGAGNHLSVRKTPGSSEPGVRF